MDRALGALVLFGGCTLVAAAVFYLGRFALFDRVLQLLTHPRRLFLQGHTQEDLEYQRQTGVHRHSVVLAALIFVFGVVFSLVVFFQ